MNSRKLREHDIFDEPSSIFNCDECGIPLNPKPLKTIHERGSKHVSAVTGNGKSQITILACASASGYALPQFVMFDRKTLNQELTKGEVPGQFMVSRQADGSGLCSIFLNLLHQCDH